MDVRAAQHALTDPEQQLDPEETCQTVQVLLQNVEGNLVNTVVGLQLTENQAASPSSEQPDRTTAP